MVQSDDERYQVAVSGRFSANNLATCNAAVINGLGIGSSPRWLLQRELEQGVVEEVLADFSTPGMPVFVVWPSSVKLPARTRAFIDFLALRWVGDTFGEG